MLTTLVLILAGLMAGALNAVAGGGTFITFPALVWAGVPPIMANATATITALPGYLSSAYGYRHDLRAEGPLGVCLILTLAAIGGLAGAGLLLMTTDALFEQIVPWLLLIATLLFAAGPSIVKRLSHDGFLGLLPSILIVGAVSIYGGYFNGGLGIMLLAAFSLIGLTDLNAMNGLKNMISALTSLVSAAAYAVAGLIVWEQALIVGIASTIGGYLGARYARRVRNQALLRGGIVCVGLIMTVLFFLR